MDYWFWKIILTALGTLVVVLAPTLLPLYTTLLRTAPERTQLHQQACAACNIPAPRPPAAQRGRDCGSPSVRLLTGGANHPIRIFMPPATRASPRAVSRAWWWRWPMASAAVPSVT